MPDKMAEKLDILAIINMSNFSVLSSADYSEMCQKQLQNKSFNLHCSCTLGREHQEYKIIISDIILILSNFRLTIDNGRHVCLIYSVFMFLNKIDFEKLMLF